MRIPDGTPVGPTCMGPLSSMPMVPGAVTVTVLFSPWARRTRVVSPSGYCDYVDVVQDLHVLRREVQPGSRGHVSELGHRSVEPSPPEGALPRLLKGGNGHLLEGSGAGRAVAAASPRERSRLLRPLRPTWAAETPSSCAPRLTRMVGDGAGRLGAVTYLRRLG